MITIYGLIDPRSQQLKYVGMTSKELSVRLDRHMREVGHCHKRSWIQGLKKVGLKPDIFEIENVDDTEWEEAERFWISYFKYIGCRLTNIADGGMGGRWNSRGQKRTPEQREKMRMALLGHKTSDETKEKLRKIFIGRKFSDESKRKMSISTKRRFKVNPVSDETKKKMSIAHKGKLLGRKHSEEARKRMSETKRIRREAKFAEQL